MYVRKGMQCVGVPVKSLSAFESAGYVRVSSCGGEITEITLPDTLPTIPRTTPRGTIPVGDDSDDDGLVDSWEYNFFGNLDEEFDGDYDDDGYSNGEEYIRGSDPSNPDDPEGGNGWVWGLIGGIVILGIVGTIIWMRREGFDFGHWLKWRK